MLDRFEFKMKTKAAASRADAGVQEYVKESDAATTKVYA